MIVFNEIYSEKKKHECIYYLIYGARVIFGINTVKSLSIPS